MTLTLNSDDESEANSYYYYDEEPKPERGPRAETCAKCLAVGKDYCIANNRCTERATRTCEGAEDHVTGSPEFARTSPGHSMTCPGSEAGDRHGFLTHHGRKGFPVLLEVRGVTSDKLLQELEAHAADLSATGCETADEHCRVTFELYECSVRQGRHVPHHHHHFHRVPPIVGMIWTIANIFCFFAFVRVIRRCCCGGRRRSWAIPPAAMSRGADGNATAPFLSSSASPPVQGRIVNGVILPPQTAPSAGPANPPSTAPPAPVPQAAQALQPAVVFPMAPVVPATGYCSTCGAAHPSNHRFCGACGQPLRPAVSSGPAYPQLEAPMQAEA